MPQAQASKETVNVGGQPPVTPAPTDPKAPNAPAAPTVASVPEVAGFAGSKAEVAKNRAYYRNKMGIADTVPNTNYVSSVAPDVENPKTAEQNAREKDWNARQAAFDALNPAGTKESDVVRPTPEQAREVYAAMNAPTAPTAPTAPKAPTATAPTAPKAGETVDFNTSAGREGEITDNLNRFYAEGAKDLDTLKKMAGYDTADQGKKNLIDAFWKSKQPKTTSDYFRGLLTNEIRKPEDWKSPEYVNATKQFAAFNQFKNSTGVQIEAAVKSGALTEWSDAFRALEQANPNAIAQYRQAKANRVASENLNGYTEGLYNSMNGVNTYDKRKSAEAQTREPSPVEEFLQSLSDRLTKNETPDYAAQWREKISENPEAVRLSKEVAEKTAELRRLNTEEVELEDTIKARYAGTGADKAYIDAKIREGLKGIYSAKNEANISLQAAQSQLSAMTENAKMELDLQFKTDEARRAEEKELRGYAMDFKKMDYQQDLQLDTAQKLFEQKLRQNEQLANDPIAATNALLDSYEKMGITPTRSRNEILADVQNQVASGRTLGEALTDLNKAFQSKPEYARYKELQAGQLSDREKLAYQAEERAREQAYDWKKMMVANDLDLAKLTAQYDFSTKRDQDAAYLDMVKSGMTPDAAKSAIFTISGDWSKAGASDLFNAADGTVIPSRLKKTTNPNNGKECGEWVNDVTGLGVGDTLESKLAKMNVKPEALSKEVPAGVGVGSVATWVPSGSAEWKKYGHIGVIVGEKGDNWLIKSSNLHGQGEISTVEVPKMKILGYNDTTKVPTSQKETAEYTLADVSSFNSATPTQLAKYRNDPKYKKFVNDKDSVMKDPNADIMDVMGYSQGGKTVTDTQVQGLQKYGQAFAQLSDIQNTIKGEDTGPILGILRSNNPYDEKAKLLTSQLNALIPSLARGVYGEVGVLTDKDVEQYMKTVPSLKSTEDVNKLVLGMTLNNLANGYKSKIQILAGSGYDVSGLIGTYTNLMNQVEALRTPVSAPTTSEGWDKATYDAAVAKYGKADTDAYMSSRGITLK